MALMTAGCCALSLLGGGDVLILMFLLHKVNLDADNNSDITATCNAGRVPPTIDDRTLRHNYPLWLLHPWYSCRLHSGAHCHPET